MKPELNAEKSIPGPRNIRHLSTLEEVRHIIIPQAVESVTKWLPNLKGDWSLGRLGAGLGTGAFGFAVANAFAQEGKESDPSTCTFYQDEGYWLLDQNNKWQPCDDLVVAGSCILFPGEGPWRLNEAGDWLFCPEEEPVFIVEPTLEPEVIPTLIPTLTPTPEVKPLTFEQKVAREKQIHPIYTQFLDASGILIKAPSTVNPQALQKMKEITMLMTRHRPDIRVNIARTGGTYTGTDSHNETQIVIIPKNTSLTSLPEYTRYTGSDDKVRGLTGGGYIPFVLMSAVGEEDLLPSSKDNFLAYYEFAHVIQDGGITRDEWRRFGDIWFKYKSMFAKYTFITRDYAEFFSGLTSAYFGIAHGAIPTTAELKSVPEAYNFFASIYRSR